MINKNNKYLCSDDVHKDIIHKTKKEIFDDIYKEIFNSKEKGKHNVDTIMECLITIKKKHMEEDKCLQCDGTGIMGNEETNCVCDNCNGSGFK